MTKPSRPISNTESFRPPANLYDGISSADPEVVAEVKRGRESGYLARLSEQRREARKSGDTAKVEELTTLLHKAYDYFDKDQHAKPALRGPADPAPK